MKYAVSRLRSSMAEHEDELPVPVYDIARDAGWHITTWPDMGDVYGVCVMGNPVVAILAEELCSCDRRAVLAHEMGHILHGHTSLLNLCSGRYGELGPWLSRRQERDADWEAARLLIPESVIERYDACELAEICEVPEWLVGLRLSRPRKMRITSSSWSMVASLGALSVALL